jgi:hypothetical protein
MINDTQGEYYDSSYMKKDTPGMSMTCLAVFYETGLFWR